MPTKDLQSSQGKVMHPWLNYVCDSITSSPCLGPAHESGEDHQEDHQELPAPAAVRIFHVTEAGCGAPLIPAEQEESCEAWAPAHHGSNLELQRSQSGAVWKRSCSFSHAWLAPFRMLQKPWLQGVMSQMPRFLGALKRAWQSALAQIQAAQVSHDTACPCLETN